MYTAEAAIEDNKFVRPGYTFAGWSVEAGGEKKYEPGEVISRLKSGDGERITLYPVWTANEYTVHFDTGAGEKPDDMVYTYDKEYELPVTTRSGYRFMGWSVEDGGAVIYLPGTSASNLACEGEVTLYASWLKVEFNYSTYNSYHVTDNSKRNTSQVPFYDRWKSGGQFINRWWTYQCYIYGWNEFGRVKARMQHNDIYYYV